MQKHPEFKEKEVKAAVAAAAVYIYRTVQTNILEQEQRNLTGMQQKDLNWSTRHLRKYRGKASQNLNIKSRNHALKLKDYALE